MENSFQIDGDLCHGSWRELEVCEIHDLKIFVYHNYVYTMDKQIV